MTPKQLLCTIIIVVFGAAFSTASVAAPAGKDKSISSAAKKTSRSARDANASVAPVYINPMYPGYSENFNPHRPG